MQKLIGITGGIASGKSSVAKIIKELGYKVIQSDEVAKELMKNDPALKNAIVNEFGDEFYIGEQLNKKYIAQNIFGETDLQVQAREKLDSIVHPVVIEKNLETIEELFSKGEEMIFIESALIFEAKMQDGYDYVICVYSDEESVKLRLAERDNLGASDIEKRLQSQFSPEFKKGHSDFVIDNNKDIIQLKQSTHFILSILEALPPKDPNEEDN